MEGFRPAFLVGAFVTIGDRPRVKTLPAQGRDVVRRTTTDKAWSAMRFNVAAYRLGRTGPCFRRDPGERTIGRPISPTVNPAWEEWDVAAA